MRKFLTTILIIFIVFYFFGHFGPRFLNGETCLSLIGCNSGPLGYDAVLHVISGALYVAAIIWFVEKYPKRSFLTKRFKQNIFIILSVVALLSITWEVIEFSHDRIRLIANPSFPTEELDQPTNDDTMGDLIISMLAGAATIPFFRKRIE